MLKAEGEGVTGGRRWNQEIGDSKLGPGGSPSRTGNIPTVTYTKRRKRGVYRIEQMNKSSESRQHKNAGYKWFVLGCLALGLVGWLLKFQQSVRTGVGA